MNAEAVIPAPQRRSAWQVQRAVLFALVQREMSARVGGQWVGAIWTLFEPLAHVLMLVTVFGLMRNLPGIEYPVFLATGLIPFFFFQKLVTRLLDGIDANRGLFAYRQVKPIDALVARAVVDALMNLLVYLVTLLILGWIGYHVLPGKPLEVMAVTALIALFGLSFGTLTAVLGHDRPRLRSIIRLLFLPLYLASGVMFPVDTLPREYIDILLWNPMLHLVEISRHNFIPAFTPTDGVNVVYPLAWTLVSAALGLSLYRANRLRLLTIT